MIRKRITDIYIILLLTVFPLCFWDYYYDIADTKFIVFTGMTLGTLIAFILCRGKYIINSPVKWILIWCMANILSFLISDYKKTALLGTSGRDYGLITVFCITVMFIIIVSARPDKEKFINIFIISSVIVSILAVINSYGMDFIGFYKGVRPDLRMYYQTTLGHVDICSSFFSMALPMAVVMAVEEKRREKKVLYMLSTFTIFAGMFGGGCDSGYINMAVIVIAAIVYFKDYKSIAVFSFMCIVMIWIAKVMMVINHIVESSREMDSISVILTDTRASVLLSICILSVILICLYRIRKGADKCRILRLTLLSVILIVAAVFMDAFIYFTFIDTESDIGSMANLLRFNDEWGSCRGYVWRVTAERYINLPWYNILFGTGPDTLECMLTPVYGDEMFRRFDALYDNAHNEYLQYLFTTGITGFISYAGVVFVSVKSGIRNLKADENTAPFLIAAVCYLVQAAVNINQVITTPFMFLSLAMIAFCKEE